MGGTRRFRTLLAVAALLLLPCPAIAQGLTGALVGTVKDDQGGAIAGATVLLSSPALIGGPASLTTDAAGRLRFPGLAPGSYTIRVEMEGFATVHEGDIPIEPGLTIERTVVLKLAGLAESIVVEGAGSRIEARDSGFGTRFGLEDLKTIPTRRSSMFDLIRAAPGISPTSPSSGTITTVSAFGSGTNENQFLFDGTNFTCPCNGVARAEPGIDFIQGIQVHAVGASAEFGNVQGAVINVVTRQGGNRFQYDASYYAQMAGLTSQPVVLALAPPATGETGYERARYQDFTTNLGGPIVRDRLWFFAGYQYFRDHDSQPGTDPAFPRTFEEDKVFAKATWRITPRWQLVQSFHDQFWLSPERPTIVTPFESTNRTHATVPAVTFGHLTHTMSANTLWDVRAGRFVYTQDNEPRSADLTVPNRFDRATGVTSGSPRQFGRLQIMRTTGKASITHFRPALAGADHEFKAGVQIERGEHDGSSVTPTGVRYVDNRGLPFQAIARAPSHEGGLFLTGSAFLSDAIRIGDRLTVNAGVRFDHNRAVSQDLHAVDAEGRETDTIVKGLGTLYTWNIVSPRLGLTAKLSGDGRTILRASYGRFSQGVLTGELSPFHPGVTPTTTMAFDPATGAYTRFVSRVDSSNLRLDPETRAPRTDEYSVGVDREVGRRLAVAVAYVRKNGANFIGWTDVGGVYRDEVRVLPDGQKLPVSVLVNSTNARRFLLTNPEGYSLTYNGLVLVAEKRRSHGWQAFGSYTFSKAYGLQPSSGATAAAPQVSTIGPPNPISFGRDPNDLTNARGILPNDRPHVFRLMGSLTIPKTAVLFAANLQHFSGKPWAATAQVLLPQGDQRILLEPRGSRRLPSQTVLDLRLSRAFDVGAVGRVELLLDVLNALDDAAVEGLASDDLFNTSFGLPTVFMDPRRAMISVRLNLGR